MVHLGSFIDAEAFRMHSGWVLVDFPAVPPVAFIARVTEDRALTGEMQ
jgi:hypothetical protein